MGTGNVLGEWSCYGLSGKMPIVGLPGRSGNQQIQSKSNMI